VALLEVSDISVRFGGLQALNNVAIAVETGYVTGLIGPNGAGKTTLFNVITGLQPPSSGRVVLDGNDITYAKPHRRARVGMSRTFQRLETFGTLSVRDNVLVAAEMRRGWSRDKFDPAVVTDELIDRIGLGRVALERVDTLPTGTARLVEVARALAAQPRLLLLDEPSAGLNENETNELGTLLRALAADGLAVLLVEHDMGFVMGTCSRIHVLEFGSIIAVGTPAEVQADVMVRSAYLGSGPDEETVDTSLDAMVDPDAEADASNLARVVAAEVDSADAPTFSPNNRPPLGSDPLLELRGVDAGYGAIDVLFGVDLALYPGQVHALLGPNGAGKSTTLKVASAQITPTAGEVRLLGERVGRRSPDALARAGLCLVPEGRGIFPNLTVVENLRMATFAGAQLRDVLDRAFTRFPRLSERRKQLAGTLSGGEQQMLSMARAMSTEPKVLLLDELSMGLAPLVVETLYEVVRTIAAEGLSILIVEQFAHEVLGVANTASIMLHGRIEMTGTPGDISAALASAYLGGSISD
jgi:branched-chain amino acid transport system ATP-binding protein